jgi:hypothetical protein
MRSFLARMPQSITAAVVAAIATAAIIGGYSATHAGNDSNIIYACVTKPEGSVRIVGSDFDCDPMKEGPIQWNQQGTQGEPGPPGVIGSLNDMVGIPCGANGVTGTVSLNIAADGAISLTCSMPLDNDGDGYASPGPTARRERERHPRARSKTESTTTATGCGR